MFKLLFMIALGYFFYRLFIVPRSLNGPSQPNIDASKDSKDDEEFDDYEELD